MAAGEPGGRLPLAEVPDVDAAADPFGVLELFRQLDEPARLQAGGVLEEDERAVLQLAQARVQLAQHGQQAVGLVPHLAVVVDDQAADAAREAAGELHDRGAALLVQQVDAAVQVDRRQARMRGHELQDVLQLAGRVGVRLGGQASLGEAEAGQLEQRIVAGHAPVEQGVQGLGHLLVRAGGRRGGLAGALTIWPGLIHDPSLNGAIAAHLSSLRRCCAARPPSDAGAVGGPAPGYFRFRYCSRRLVISVLPLRSLAIAVFRARSRSRRVSSPLASRNSARSRW